MIPGFPAAYLQMDKGVVIGAQQALYVSNALQKQVELRVEKMFPNDERIGLKKYGVSYHIKMPGGKHVWIMPALNEEIQEIVAEALAGVKPPLAEASVFQAADELQRHQKGI
jgi:hypothetical protein